MTDQRARDTAITKLGPAPQASKLRSCQPDRWNKGRFLIVAALPSFALAFFPVLAVGALLPEPLPDSQTWIGGLVHLFGFVLSMTAAEKLMWPMIERQRHRVRLRTLATPTAGEISIVSPPLDQSALAVELQGRVVPLKTLSAPLSGRPCVAFGLVGHGAYGPVADAEAAAFLLITEDRGEVLVDAPHVVIQAEPARAAEIMASKPCMTFLEPKGVYPKMGRLLVSETRIEDGDVVHVEGLPDEETRGDGYRATTRTAVLRGTASHPVRITPVRKSG